MKKSEEVEQTHCEHDWSLPEDIVQGAEVIPETFGTRWIVEEIKISKLSPYIASKIRDDDICATLTSIEQPFVLYCVKSKGPGPIGWHILSDEVDHHRRCNKCNVRFARFLRAEYHHEHKRPPFRRT